MTYEMAPSGMVGPRASRPHATGVTARAGVAPLTVMSDRAGGVLVGQACGDALGVPYEFVAPRVSGRPQMKGGGIGNYAPGEWSDDTQLAICLAEIAATGTDFTLEETLDEVANRYIAALRSGVKELDAQTRVVFDSVLYDDVEGRPAQKMRRAAAYFHRRTLRSAGNGALARTAILGLTRISDPDWTAAAARTVAELTHVDPLAGDSCVLLAEAVRRAVTDPQLDPGAWRARLHLDSGIELLPAARRGQWVEWLGEAGQPYFKPPLDNSFTVAALQAAIAAIVHAAAASTCDDPRQAFRVAVEEAVRVGGDTDTIAAITGALMGAAVGLEAIPTRWVHLVHGWPGLDAEGLHDLALASALAGIVGETQMATMVAQGIDLRALITEHARAQASVSTHPHTPDPFAPHYDDLDIVDPDIVDPADLGAEGESGIADEASAPYVDALEPAPARAHDEPAVPADSTATEVDAGPATEEREQVGPAEPVRVETTAAPVHVYVPGLQRQGAADELFTPEPVVEERRSWSRLRRIRRGGDPWQRPAPGSDEEPGSRRD